MFSVFELLHWPFWKRSPLGALLPVLGVALGVAAIVAVDLAGASAVESFRHTLERLEGRTTHRVVGARIPDDLPRRLARLLGVEAAAPVVEAVAVLAGTQEPLTLLGLDPLAEGAIRSLGVAELLGGGRTLRDFMGRPGALLVSGVFLERHGLREGDRLPLVLGARQRGAFVLARLPREVDGRDVPEALAVGDVATIQELAGRFDGVDRVDLVIAKRHRAATLSRLEVQLPRGARLEKPGVRAARLERMLAAFRTNIRALSYLALFVSFFLIYNSMLLSVLRRRSLIGITRCLGATRMQILAGWLLEALLTGAAGAALGVGLGLLFAGPALKQVSRTAADLYGASGGGTLSIVPAALIRAAAIGLFFTLLTALIPALEAARTPPAHTAARSGVERIARRRRDWAPLAAPPLAAVAVAALAWPGTSPVPGYVAALSLALAGAVLVPSVVDRLLELLLSRRFGIRRGVLRMAASNIRSNMSRTGVALAALAMALSMAVAMGTLVASFRHELVRWIDESLRADVYVSPLALEADPEGATLPEDLPERLAALPQVTAVDRRHGYDATVRGRDIFLSAVDIPVLRRRVDWPVLAGAPEHEFFDALEAGEAGISEALQRKTGIAPGERIALILDGTVDSLTVAGIYRDYTTDRGVVLVDRRAFSRRRELGAPRSLGLYLREGADVAKAIAAVRRAAGAGLALEVRSNADLRARVLAIFERTFAITRGLELVGLAVAAIGILGALMAMLLERTRELATLRALGLTRLQLGAMFFGESTMLAILAWLFALAIGSLLAWILLDVINLRSFGWALEYEVPWGAWAAALGSSLVASWAATLWPLRQLSRMALAPLLREE